MSSKPADRAVLDFKCAGWRSGAPVLLLHGYTDSRRSYDRVLAQMPDFLNAIAVSQRGHGDSDRPEQGYCPSDFSADLLHFMDAMNIERAVMVGHSLGACIAQRFAIDFPDRTLGLVLVGSFYTLNAHPAALELWNSTVSRLADPIDPNTVRTFQAATVAHALPAGFFELVVQESLKVPARVWKDALRCAMESDFSMELPKIKAPTRLIWGERDAFATRLEQSALLAAIPGSSLSIYEGAGHAPHWEEPARFVNEVADFVRDLIARA